MSIIKAIPYTSLYKGGSLKEHMPWLKEASAEKTDVTNKTVQPNAPKGHVAKTPGSKHLDKQAVTGKTAEAPITKGVRTGPKSPYKLPSHPYTSAMGTKAKVDTSKPETPKMESVEYQEDHAEDYTDTDELDFENLGDEDLGTGIEDDDNAVEDDNEEGVIPLAPVDETSVIEYLASLDDETRKELIKTAIQKHEEVEPDSEKDTEADEEAEMETSAGEEESPIEDTEEE